jgi:hypothetical protein
VVEKMEQFVPLILINKEMARAQELRLMIIASLVFVMLAMI